MTPLLITILGPTASGKTALAAEVAWRTQGEVISADSRQVFRGMDLGTGKDLADYNLHGTHVPYHLIDICSPNEEYSAYRFVNDFVPAFNSIVSRGHQPILCGGTGLYIDAIVRRYQLSDAPIDPDYRTSLSNLSDEELTLRLASYGPLHNHTDTETRDRLVRALEIQEYAQAHPEDYTRLPDMRHIVFGTRLERQETIGRIERRLRRRLDEGMTDEVQRLIDSGVSSLIENMAIVMVPIFAAIIYRIPPKKKTLFCAALAVVGVGFLSLTQNSSANGGLGIVLMILAAMTYAVCIMVTERVSRDADPLTIGMIQLGTMGVLSLAASVLSGSFGLPQGGQQWTMMLLLVLLCSCFGFAFQPLGQKYLPAEEAAVLTVVNPFTASIMGIVIAGESLSTAKIIGYILILTALIVYNLKMKPKNSLKEITR